MPSHAQLWRLLPPLNTGLQTGLMGPFPCAWQGLSRGLFEDGVEKLREPLITTELATCPGAGEKVSALHDLHSISSDLGPTLAPNRQMGACGAPGTGEGQVEKG